MPALRPSRRSAIAAFTVMEVLAAANRRAAAGGTVLHLEIGEPGGGAPSVVLDAARRALDGAGLGYTEALGLPELRARIARHYRVVHGLDVPSERIVVTSGASGAFVLAFLAAFDAGDRVAVAVPAYPAYCNILRALDVEVVPIPTGPATRFQPTVELLDALPGPLHGLVLASPANPTGTMLRADALAGLAAWCRGRGVRLVSDEIYHGITYAEPGACALASTDDAVIVNSFSKYFCMTGWRLGWAVVPEDLLGPLTRLAQNLFIAPSAIAQHAALAAFDAAPELDARVIAYRRNRDRLIAALQAGGLGRIAPPDGAFYLWVDIRERGETATEFCRRLLAETGIAVTPGIDFDAERGEAWIRLSFAGAETMIAEAATELARWLRRPPRGCLSPA